MRQGGGGQEAHRGGPGHLAAGIGRGLLSMIDNRRIQWNNPPPQNPQPLPFPTPFSWSAQRSAPPPHHPSGHQCPAPPSPRSSNNAPAPAVKPTPVPQPPVLPSAPRPIDTELVSSEERSKMSVQEYEDYLLSVALSLSTKEEEDKKSFIVDDETPNKPEQPNPADAFQVKKDSALDHKDLEGWLQFQEVSKSAAESKLDQNGSAPMKLYDIPLPPLLSQSDSVPSSLPQLPETKSLHEGPKEPCLMQANLNEPSAPIFSVTKEVKFGHRGMEGTAVISVVKQTYPSLQDIVTTNTTATTIESVPVDCGDSSEDQMEGGDESSTSSPRGRKRKNDSLEPREKRRKTKKKMIKLQQELKEKEERIKGLEDQIEESDKKFVEQNERLSRLERTLTEYEKNNAELGSTWCAIM